MNLCIYCPDVLKLNDLGSVSHKNHFRQVKITMAVTSMNTETVGQSLGT